MNWTESLLCAFCGALGDHSRGGFCFSVPIHTGMSPSFCPHEFFFFPSQAAAALARAAHLAAARTAFAPSAGSRGGLGVAPFAAPEGGAAGAGAVGGPLASGLAASVPPHAAFVEEAAAASLNGNRKRDQEGWGKGGAQGRSPKARAPPFYEDEGNLGQEGDEWAKLDKKEEGEGEEEAEGEALDASAEEEREDGCTRRHLAFRPNDWHNAPLKVKLAKNPYWKLSKYPERPATWAVHILRAEARIAEGRGDAQDEILCSRLRLAPSSAELADRERVRERRRGEMDRLHTKWQGSAEYRLAPDGVGDGVGSGGVSALLPSAALPPSDLSGGPSGGIGGSGAAGGGAGAGAGAGGIAPPPSLVEPKDLQAARKRLAALEEEWACADFPRPPEGRRLADAKAEMARARANRARPGPGAASQQARDGGGMAGAVTVSAAAASGGGGGGWGGAAGAGAGAGAGAASMWALPSQVSYGKK